MKATRKLIPAFAMLLIAAVMMSTATFAWFSSNSDVNVNNFQVTAKADTTYIVVSKTAGQVDNKGTEIAYTEFQFLPDCQSFVLSHSSRLPGCKDRGIRMLSLYSETKRIATKHHRRSGGF